MYVIQIISHCDAYLISKHTSAHYFLLVIVDEAMHWHKDLFCSISDYVFFETSSTTPYQIRRIEELNKVAWINIS